MVQLQPAESKWSKWSFKTVHLLTVRLAQIKPGVDATDGRDGFASKRAGVEGMHTSSTREHPPAEKNLRKNLRTDAAVGRTSRGELIPVPFPKARMAEPNKPKVASAVPVAAAPTQAATFAATLAPVVVCASPAMRDSSSPAKMACAVPAGAPSPGKATSQAV